MRDQRPEHGMPQGRAERRRRRRQTKDRFDRDGILGLEPRLVSPKRELSRKVAIQAGCLNVQCRAGRYRRLKVKVNQTEEDVGPRIGMPIVRTCGTSRETRASTPGSRDHRECVQSKMVCIQSHPCRANSKMTRSTEYTS